MVLTIKIHSTHMHDTIKSPLPLLLLQKKKNDIKISQCGRKAGLVIW